MADFYFIIKRHGLFLNPKWPKVAGTKKVLQEEGQEPV